MNKLAALLLLAFSTLAFASSCPDANLRGAKIGGDAIRGVVLLKHKPLKKAYVRLYFGGKIVWRGVTDQDGRFEINHLKAGSYRLVVPAWGSADVEFRSELDTTGLHQRPTYSLLLSDEECIATVVVVN
jgi:hypothetical protein